MTDAKPSIKVLYVALDACDSALMERLAADGHCPNIASLLQRGAVVDTRAPYGTFVGSSWMTITTGSNVDRHRFWNWYEVDPTTYALAEPTPREALGTPFWVHLSDAGKRVAVFDVPHADVPTSFNGVVLKEWGCHDRHDGTASYPPELLGEIVEAVGEHPVGCRSHPGEGIEAFAPCDQVERAGLLRTIDEERALHDLLRAGIDAKHRASLQMMGDGPWDLFATVLGESHCVGHQLWHVHDETHPRHDPAARRLLGDPVEDVYIRLDRVLGDLVDQVDPDTTVYVHMNHGMGPHFDGDHLFDALLARIDEALAGRYEPGSWSRAGRAAYGRIPQRARGAARQAIAVAARAKARRGEPIPAERVWPNAGRRFYQIPGNTVVGAVRFNVVGRESAGLVHPGTELDALYEQVAAALLDVVDIDSGRPFVRSVVRSDEVFGRAADDRLPDLFVEWERSSLVERVWSPLTGTVAAPYAHWRTGDHHDAGLFIAAGPGIEAGRRPGSMSLTDVAPTISAALGVELPDIDGVAHHDLVGGRRSTVRAELDRERIDALEAQLAELRDRVAASERELLIRTTMGWLDHEPVVDDVLVSVVLPTHARPERLAEALESVVAQRHQRWEAVVVDDGSNTAAAVVDRFDDERIHLVEVAHGGVCRARNIALEHVKGDLITYLDDDNRLDPGWLHALTWAFANHPDSNVLYGARVFDDLSRTFGRGAGGWPWLQFNQFDRHALEHYNLADMGVIAHRSTCEARFDEHLAEFGDWDFFLSLTADEVPLELPVVAFYYRTDLGDRLSGQHPADIATVRAKWAQRRVAAGGHEATA